MIENLESQERVEPSIHKTNEIAFIETKKTLISESLESFWIRRINRSSERLIMSYLNTVYIEFFCVKILPRTPLLIINSYLLRSFCEQSWGIWFLRFCIICSLLANLFLWLITDNCKEIWVVVKGAVIKLIYTLRVLLRMKISPQASGT